MKLSCACAIVAVWASAGLADDEDPTLAPDGDKKLESATKDERKTDDDTRTSRYLLAAGESALIFGATTAWYWANSDLQKPDWDLAWDGESWKKKLTGFDVVRFDTNPFHVNAFGHTGQAILMYHAGRGNGLGVTGAALINLGATFAWEYLIEYREYPSLNDLIVNTMSGPALGEPLWQIGAYFRTGRKTWGNEALAAFFQPFDEIERRVNHRGWRESRRPWHRLQLSGGTRVDGSRTDASLAADLEVVSFDRSGVRDGWTPAGGWNRIAGGIDFGANGVSKGHFYSRTSFGGYQSRAIYDDGIGRSAFIGFGTGITYENSDLGMERDQFAAFHLIGPQADLHLRTRNLDVRWQAAAYGDLAMVHALALGAMPPIDPEPPWSSPLTRPDGYYFGVGTTGWTRLLVSYDRWHGDLEGHAHQVWSLDKKNADRGEPPPPTNLADGRLYGKLRFGYDIIPDRFAVDTVLDLAARRGRIEGGGDRTNTESQVGVLLTLQH